MPLVRTLQVTNTARRPASETEQGQRLPTGLLCTRQEKNSVVVLTMGLSVFKQGRVSVQHLQDSGTKAEHMVQRKHCDVAVLQGRSFNSATGQAAGLLLGVLRLHAGAPCPAARRNGRQAWRRKRDIGGEGATDSSSRRGVVQRVALFESSMARVRRA
jgi:hypothetical protein